MRNFAYRDRRMHMGIPVCKRAGIAKIFAYGDPITHNEVVRIRGLTYTPVGPFVEEKELVHNISLNLGNNYKIEIVARYPKVSILGIWNSHVEPVSLTLAKLACAFWHTLGTRHIPLPHSFNMHTS